MSKLYVIGVSSGKYEDLTIKAYNTLMESDLIYCDEKMYTILKEYIDDSKLVPNEYCKTRQRCINAINSASSDKTVSIVGSGDTGLYGISALIIKLLEDINPNLDLEVISGIPSFLYASSLLGSPITKDYALISLSDNFDTEEGIRERLEAVAKTNMIIVFYSPTPDNLKMAKEVLLKYRNPNTLVGIVSSIGYDSQNLIMTNVGNLDIKDPLSTIIVGNNETELSNTMVRRLVTPLY